MMKNILFLMLMTMSFTSCSYINSKLGIANDNPVEKVVEEVAEEGAEELIKDYTGINLDPTTSVAPAPAAVTPGKK